jgi:hypothetical protein
VALLFSAKYTILASDIIEAKKKNLEAKRNLEYLQITNQCVGLDKPIQ